MTTITEFLLARIAEDEAMAEAAWHAVQFHDNGSWHCERDWTGTTDQATLATAATRTVFVSNTAIVDPDDDGRSIGVATHAEVRHIAHHDPKRVLAECEAKRRIVEEVEEIRSMVPEYVIWDGDEHQVVIAEWADATVLRYLASVYADHPDFREEWRP